MPRLLAKDPCRNRESRRRDDERSERDEELARSASGVPVVDDERDAEPDATLDEDDQADAVCGAVAERVGNVRDARDCRRRNADMEDGDKLHRRAVQRRTRLREGIGTHDSRHDPGGRLLQTPAVEAHSAKDEEEKHREESLSNGNVSVP